MFLKLFQMKSFLAHNARALDTRRNEGGVLISNPSGSMIAFSCLSRVMRIKWRQTCSIAVLA